MSRSTILEFEGVTCRGAPAGREPVSFRLGRGEMLRVGPDAMPLADLAGGLEEPAAGCVRFLGEDWAGLGPDRQATLRGRIGRVFARQAWVSNLTVAENITLATRYHTDEDESAIVRRAEALAGRLLLGAIPHERPEAVPHNHLHRWQWVRALLAHPALLVLAQPDADAGPDAAALLTALVGEAQAEGTAVLWITPE